MKSAPDVFVGSVNRRIAIVDAETGKVNRFLTPGGRWVLDSHPVLVDVKGRQYVYYLHENFKRCPNSIRRVPLRGGGSERVTRQGFQILGLSVSPNNQYLAYSIDGCRAPVVPDSVEVVSLDTGHSLLRLNTPANHGDPPINLGTVTVTNHHLIAFAGGRRTTWLAVLDLEQSPARTALRSLPRIPVRCRLDALAASPAPSRVYGSVACGQRIRTFTASGKGLQRVRYSDPIPLALDWVHVSSRNRQGWYIGIGNPPGKGWGDHIVEWRGGSGRVLGKCSTPKYIGGRCAQTPTWSTLASHTSSRQQAVGHRQFDKPGIKSEVDPPAPSIQFGTSNAWIGKYQGDHVAVYAGDAGYERPETGSVMVFTYDDDRSTPLGYTRTIPGSGALKVVAFAEPIVELQDQSGNRYELNLDTRTLQ